MEDEDLLDLMNKIYSELDFGFKAISYDISNLKNDLSENSTLLENLNPKIKDLIKVQKSFKKQLDELKNKIANLSKKA